MDHHCGNILERQSTHLAYSPKYCNVGGYPRQEGSRVKLRVQENKIEEEEPQQLLGRENREVGRGEGKSYAKKKIVSDNSL